MVCNGIQYLVFSIQVFSEREAADTLPWDRGRYSH